MIDIKTKYSTIDTEAINTNIHRLTNQIWKLIPMRENNEDWQKQLDSVIIEIAGLTEICQDSAILLQLLSKLEGLKKTCPSFEIFRKTVFESISLLRGAL